MSDSNWGKGVINGIGWGQLATNDIGAGSIYSVSHSGETALIGTSAAFSYSANTFTQADADPTPTITGTTGGTFSGTSGLVFVSTSTGQIDLSASTIASHVVTYTVNEVSADFSLSVTAAPYQPFQMQFEVASGVSKTISIPNTVGNNYTVNWGDGATTTETGGTISHTYNDGINSDVTNPTVSIGSVSDTGPFTYFKFGNALSDTDLIDVPRWGSIQWSNMSNMFFGCSNSNFTNITASDTPNLTNVTNMSGMFRSCSNLVTVNNLNSWDTSNVTNMNRMFLICNAFNSDCSSWDTSNVTDMSFLFQNCFVFNQDLGNWNVSSVTNMSSMFQSSRVFNSDIGSWNVSNVTDMSSMFFSAQDFNQDIDSWDVSSVTKMSSMFRSAQDFNQDLTNWDVSNVTNINRMFLFAISFNGDVRTWNLNSASNMDFMFHGSVFNQNLSNWDLRTAGTSMSFITSPNTYSQANYTDTMVGWAVYVHTNSGPFNVQWTSTSPSLDFTRTSDNTSGQTYAVKYGSNWTATGWTNAQDAYDYLIGAVAGWTIN